MLRTTIVVIFLATWFMISFMFLCFMIARLKIQSMGEKKTKLTSFKDFWDCKEYDCTDEHRRGLQIVRRTAIVMVGGILLIIGLVVIYILVIIK